MKGGWGRRGIGRGCLGKIEESEWIGGWRLTIGTERGTIEEEETGEEMAGGMAAMHEGMIDEEVVEGEDSSS